jgi:hypothetical protein
MMMMMIIIIIIIAVYFQSNTKSINIFYGKTPEFFNIKAFGTCLGGRNWSFVKMCARVLCFKCKEGITTLDDVPCAQ